MTKYQQFARDNYKPGDPLDDMWHPEVAAECAVMNQEVEAKRLADQKKVKQVVESVGDLEEQMKGKIVIFVRSNGSLPASKKLTRPEKDALLSASDDVAKKCGMDKPLFGKFDAYDELERRRAEWKAKIKAYGIPFFGEGMTVLDIRLIPEVESLFDEIDQKMPALVEAMLAEYPKAISPEEVKIGSLYNPRDYKLVEELRKLFTWTRKWMPSFDVPDILKEVDMARWEAERKRSAALWAEVRQNGMVLLRKQVAEMTERLVEAVQPDEKTGEKKRFYATSITNLTDFFETFQNRDLAGDKDLAKQVEELKALIGNRDVEKFKTDEALRKQVATAGAKIVSQVKTLLVEAKGRVITYED